MKLAPGTPLGLAVAFDPAEPPMPAGSVAMDGGLAQLEWSREVAAARLPVAALHYPPEPGLQAAPWRRAREIPARPNSFWRACHGDRPRCLAGPLLGGLPLLHEASPIPFKARPYLDLGRRKAAGEKVDSGDVRKHRNDVFRLLQLLPADGTLGLPGTIAADMRAFVGAVAGDETFEPSAFGLRLSGEDGLARLSAAYRL